MLRAALRRARVRRIQQSLRQDLLVAHEAKRRLAFIARSERVRQMPRRMRCNRRRHRPRRPTAIAKRRMTKLFARPLPHCMLCLHAEPTQHPLPKS